MDMSSVIYVSTNWMPLVLYKLQQTKIKDNLNNGVSHPLILQKDKCYQLARINVQNLNHGK